MTRYVDLNSPNPTPPYSSWTTAATNIQDAVDVAVAGDLVLVTNGIYQTGGRLVAGDSLTNRVAVTKPLTLQSVNGPDVTVIRGYQVPGVTNHGAAVRCVYLTNNASLVGFTLTGGATRTNMTFPTYHQVNGGGVRCESFSASVSNCVMSGNAAFRGAGSYLGTYYQCVFSNNWAQWTYGGGYGGRYYNCLFTANATSGWGGGLGTGVISEEQAIVNSCTIVGNSAAIAGGGVQIQTGGGASSRLWASNSIIYGNSAPDFPNCETSEFTAKLSYCCLYPLPTNGVGHITNAPVFINEAEGDYRLQQSSPCINAGNNACVAELTDLDGNPRIVGGAADIGAYEFQSPASVLSYVWAQQNGLPTDGSADFSDADGDGANNWQEWRADTIPTNSISALRLVSATNSPNGAVIAWQSVATRNYWLERATNLGVASPFQTIATNIVGTAGIKTFTDSTATGGGPYFYRIGVQ